MRSLCPCFSFVVHTTLSLSIRCSGLKDYRIFEFFLYFMIHIHNFDNLFWTNYHLCFFKWSLNYGPFGGSQATSGQPDQPPLPCQYLDTLYAAVATDQTLSSQVTFQRYCPFPQGKCKNQFIFSSYNLKQDLGRERETFDHEQPVISLVCM